jgi:hypothetical protein
MSRENSPIVCDLLFQQIDKPEGFEMCRAINVYDNRYRVNVYTRKYDNIYDVERVRITQSYFCHLQDKDELVIVA